MESKEEFIGKKLGVDVDKGTIIKAYHGTCCRVVPPNGAITMDYIEDRVNIFVDDFGIIQKITMG